MPAEPGRSRLHVVLPRPTQPIDPALRHPRPEDVPELGDLALRAYRGTPDDGDVGSTPQEAAQEMGRVFDGTYGPPILDASYVAAHEGRLVAGALVTWWKDGPLLAYLFTAPEHAGTGLGSRLVNAVMAALGELGHTSLNLAVTEHNRAARRLYERLGFVAV
ncbi:GNAT family N-acetyltransferase [Allokutzneria albata]|uniref:Acetyltransferase (GNAT) family protein n=1 Tax=Allokutzneria albata TaxID=211114 RepID=A0A1G9ZUG8_ALLAB|nr:GNAT family N-acetyltransferase [Allokutzneria albata]SDN24383.1 Acetyltransferase (GNAT) family protein [Allokutzneria albata]